MFKHFHLKLLAIFAATLFWFFTVSFQHNIKEFPQPIPIEAFNLSEDLAVKADIDHVKIRITSEKLDLKKMDPSHFKAFVDLQNLEKGTHLVDVKVTTDEKELTIAQITPANIEVTLQQKTSKTVPIEVEVEGAVSEGYEVGEAEFGIKKATISGIPEYINTLSQVTATVTFVGTETNDVNQKVKLKIAGNEFIAAEHINIEPEEIEVVVPIKQITHSKFTGIKPVFTGNLPTNTWLSETKFNLSNIEISGEKPLLNTIRYVETEAITLDEIQTSIIRRIPLVFPPGITPANPNETTVLMELNISNIPPDGDVSDGPPATVEEETLLESLSEALLETPGETEATE